MHNIRKLGRIWLFRYCEKQQSNTKMILTHE